MHSLTSFFKTPLTDISGCVFTHQNFGYCRDMEMKVVNCLEAYGQDRGLITCKDLVDDYHECYLKFKQDARRRALLQERQKQNVYEPPPREDALS